MVLRLAVIGVLAAGCGSGAGVGADATSGRDGATADAGPDATADAGGGTDTDGGGGVLAIDQWGTSDFDGIEGIAVGSGGVVVAGSTSGALDGQSSAGSSDLFIAAREPVATRWTRQWGTTGADYGHGIVADGAGGWFVVGNVIGTLGDKQIGAGDAVVSHWTSAPALDSTTQWGTTTSDEARAIARDSSGNLLVAGFTLGALDGNNAGDDDVFLSKLDDTGKVQWSAQWGSAAADGGLAVAVDDAGNAYVVGETWGMIATPVSGSGRSVFCTKVDSGGTIKWTTQWGSDATDFGFAVAVTSTGAVLAAGHAGGDLGGTGSGGAFVTRLDPSDGSIVWTRQLGATADDEAHALAVGSAGSFYVAGVTSGEMVAGAYEGAQDLFVQKRTAAGDVVWTKQLGTAKQEKVNAVATAGTTVYVGGATRGSFPGYTNAGFDDNLLIAIPEP